MHVSHMMSHECLMCHYLLHFCLFSQVKLPHVDWGRVLDADLNSTPSFKIATGYERLQMPEGLQVWSTAAVTLSSG